MQNIIIFNGFETVKFTANVFNHYTKGATALWGFVVFRGSNVRVEKMADGEWWGRTT
jgi:hypothetical protein